MQHARPSRARQIALALSIPLLVLGGALAGLIALRTAPRQVDAAASIPAGMPSHFSFGLMDSPGDVSALTSMRSNNGTAWDFRYQYLSAGVNTGSGWATWNSPAGQFATNYMNESNSNGITPAFVYYQLLQSNGPSGGSESGNDLAHLDSPSTMNAYYADWALLMQKIGSYGKPVLVVVEPDLWGFMEQAALAKGSNSAASIPASVASSGYSAAQGYPDTAQGFAWTLLHIRDLYAHNAILALHASTWGTGVDIASDTSANVNASAIGTQTGQFLDTAGLQGVPSGVSTFDLVSNDIADHDSGQSGIWWDPTNTSFPNFSRYLSFASALSSATSRRIIMWQVPVGNQYFDTENNSAGHTQDNKAQYILGHIASFAQAGIIGVLFGPGNGGTNATDVRQDGVTNPAPISTYDCNMCNNHTSSYPDDDGGYLRIFLGQYYRNGAYALSGGTSAPAPTNTPPAPTATSVPPTATATPAPTNSSTPTPAPSGSGTPAPACATPSISFGSGNAAPGSAAPGSPILMSIALKASCAISALVDFELYNQSGTKVWQSWQNNKSLTDQTQTFSTTWNAPSTEAAGTYTLKVGVFSTNWGKLYGWDDNATSLTETAAASACSGNPAITFGSGSAAPVSLAPGATTTLSETLTSSCASKALIDFEVYDSSGNQVFQAWQDNQSLTGQPQTFSTHWTVPAGQPAGTYTLKIGVFGTGWSAFYAWNDNATQLKVS